MKKETIKKALTMYKDGGSRADVARMIMQEEQIGKTQGHFHAKRIWDNNFQEEYEPQSQQKQEKDDLGLDDPEEGQKVVYKKEKGEDGAVAYSVKGNGYIPTLEEIHRVMGLDPTEWSIYDLETGTYQVSRKNRRGEYEFQNGKMTGWVEDKGGMYVQPMYTLKFKAKRVLPMPKKELLEEFKNFAKEFAPKNFNISTYNPKGENAILISLVDHHLGVAGLDYTLKDSLNLFRDANNFFMERAKSEKVTKVFFQEGQDFYHIDNFKNSTTKGTPVDVNTPYKKLFIEGCKVHYEVLEKWGQFFETEVLSISGNHDEFSALALAEAIKQRFYYHENVSVDNEPSNERIYKTWGKVLLGFTHGDREKRTDLPILMATESPDFSSCPYRYFYGAHIHHERSYEDHGIIVEMLPSLVDKDRYHNRSGYTMQRRRSKAVVFNKNEGKISEFYYNT